MANILDEMIKMQQDRKLPDDPSTSKFVTSPENMQETTASGGIINYSPAKPTNYSGPMTWGPTAAPTASEERDAEFLPGGSAYSLSPQQLIDRRLEIGLQMNARGRGRHGGGEALAASQITKEATRAAVMETNEAHRNVSSSDLARKISLIDKMNPNARQEFYNAVAAHPTAEGKMVDLASRTFLGGLERYEEALQKGGASEFGSKENKTPEFEAYMRGMAESKGDPEISRAHALETRKGEMFLNDAQSKRLFDRDKDGPALLNKNGSMNYGAAEKLVAKRLGEGEGIKADAALNAAEQNTMRTFPAIIESLALDDPSRPAYVSGLQSATDAQNARRERDKNKKAEPVVAATAPAKQTLSQQLDALEARSNKLAAPAAPAEGKVKTKTRNGIVYRQQPDGTFK